MSKDGPVLSYTELWDLYVSCRKKNNKLKAENERLKTRIEKLHKIAEENTMGYEAIIESLRSENEKLKEKKGIK